MKLEKRYSDGYSYLFAYTLAQSKDTRSYDPVFTVVSTGNAQSASSTPFDIKNRSLNYALSDFDRRHVLSATFVYELPFGRDKRLGKGAGGVVNQIIGGWQVAGQGFWESGRPFTVYAGTNTLSNIVQTPANCGGCSSDLGSPYDDAATGLKWFFTEEDRAKFSAPGAGQFSDVGRNAFTGPSQFNMNLSLLKRFVMPHRQTLEFRADATNVTNTVAFAAPTAVTTSTTFGRIGFSTVSGSRKIQLGLKYTF